MSEAVEKWLQQLRNIAVVGAGTMGPGIGQVFAQAGFNVRLCDVSQDILQKALARIESSLASFVENGLLTGEAKRQALDRLRLTTSLGEALRDADFAIEAVPEKLELKQQVFRQMEGLCPPHAILASNTSGLFISHIGSGCQRQENLVVTHFVVPPNIIPVVEVVPGPRTSPATVDRTCALLKKVGKVPVRLRRETPGFIANRLQAALFREALALYHAGVASPEDIDAVVKRGFGLRLSIAGIYEVMDLAGLDAILNVANYLFSQIDASQEPPQFLRDMVRQGRLGEKAGEGFYRYDPALLSARVKEREEHLLKLAKRGMASESAG